MEPLPDRLKSLRATIIKEGDGRAVVGPMTNRAMPFCPPAIFETAIFETGEVEEGGHCFFDKNCLSGSCASAVINNTPSPDGPETYTAQLSHCSDCAVNGACKHAQRCDAPGECAQGPCINRRCGCTDTTRIRARTQTMYSQTKQQPPPLHIGLPDGAPCHSDDECRNGPCNALDDLAPAVGDELLHGDLARLYATSNLELDQQIASQDLRHIHKEIAQPQP